METASAQPDPDNGKKRSSDDKPVLLKAIELILAKPENIRAEAQSLLDKYRRRYKSDRADDDIRDMAAQKVTSNYSYYAAFSGGATALTGVIPGLGTAVATFGGATADTALCMKFQIEMVMALATMLYHCRPWDTQRGRQRRRKATRLKSICRDGTPIPEGCHPYRRERVVQENRNHFHAQSFGEGRPIRCRRRHQLQCQQGTYLVCWE